MKYFKSLTLGAAILLASCSQFESKEDYHNHSISPIFAEIEGETRTGIGEKGNNGYKVVWNEGDRIIVSTGTSSKSQMTYITHDKETASASFYPEDSGKALDFSGGAIAGYPVENMYLGAPDNDKEVYFTIPSVQNYVKDSFDSEAMPMISEIANEPSLKFHNAAGVIKLMVSTELSDIKVSSISIITSGIISGECGYIPASKDMFFDDSMLSSNEVTLDCQDGVEISETSTAFHIVVPHQTYGDMAIKILTTEGLQQTFSLKDGKEIEVGRSTIAAIPLKLTTLSQEGKPQISAKVISTTFSNIRFEVKMENIASYYCGLQTKLSFYNDTESGHLLSSIPYMTSYTTPLSYTGYISSFQPEFKDILIEPGQSYVIWFVPYKSSGEYSADDIVYIETMTQSYRPGGTVKVNYTDLAIDKTSISMRLNAPGASHIYAQLMTEDDYMRFRSESEIIKMFLEPGGRSTVLDSESDIFVRKFLKPGTTMVLVAMAIDRIGQYGPLTVEYFVTEHIPYNSIKVSIEKDIDKLRKSQTISWTSTNGTATEYRYIFKETDSYLWKNTLEESVKTAQEKMYIDPDLYYITHTSYPEASLKNLVSGQEYMIVVVAADSSDNISIADSWRFIY